jgi:uncharacterized protein (DUF2235 family)
VYFDEARTNVYKLFRATRVGPDTNIDPARQLAFYDPGLGTQPSDGSSINRAYRTIYNFVSQATGLGITRNIIDCYAAIIDLWRPGDRIYLFGFSRGAYTVRCLATVLCYCGIPTQGKNGSPLKRSPSATSKIAAEAVKGVYQHVSSNRDAQYFEQRKELAEKFRSDYGCGKGGPSEFPFFVGVFDTVAALSNRGSLCAVDRLAAGRQRVGGMDQFAAIRVRLLAWLVRVRCLRSDPVGLRLHSPEVFVPIVEMEVVGDRAPHDVSAEIL